MPPKWVPAGYKKLPPTSKCILKGLPFPQFYSWTSYPFVDQHVSPAFLVYTCMLCLLPIALRLCQRRRADHIREPVQSQRVLQGGSHARQLPESFS